MAPSMMPLRRGSMDSVLLPRLEKDNLSCERVYVANVCVSVCERDRDVR
jgi:hypothetical protein